MLFALILLGIGTTAVSTVVTAVVTSAILKCTERHPSVLYMEISDDVLLIPPKIPSKPILKNPQQKVQDYLINKFDEFGKPLTIYGLNEINKKWKHAYRHATKNIDDQKYETWPVRVNSPIIPCKKVTMCNMVKVILIPTHKEFIDKEKIWWSENEIRDLKHENIMELAKEKIHENQVRESKHYFNKVLDQLLSTYWRLPCYVSNVDES